MSFPKDQIATLDHIDYEDLEDKKGGCSLFIALSVVALLILAAC